MSGSSRLGCLEDGAKPLFPRDQRFSLRRASRGAVLGSQMLGVGVQFWAQKQGTVLGSKAGYSPGLRSRVQVWAWMQGSRVQFWAVARLTSRGDTLR
eukprot:3197425-Rhodomonas_salina.1